MALSSMQRTVLGYASQAAAFYGIDATIFFAQLIQEANMRWDRVGADGEVGPGQFMPATWTGVVLAHPELTQMFGAQSAASGRSNVIANVFAAAAHLADLLSITGSYFNALARYNGGNSAQGQQNGINNNYPQLVLGGATNLVNGNTDADITAALAALTGGGEVHGAVEGETFINQDGSAFTVAIDDADPDAVIVGQIINRNGFDTFVALNGTFSTQTGTVVTYSNGQFVSSRTMTPTELQAAGLPFAAGSDSGALTLSEQIELLEAQAEIARRNGDHARAEDFQNQIKLLREQQEFSDDQRQQTEAFQFKINRLGALDQLTSTLLQLQSQNRIGAIQAIGQDPLGGAIQARSGTQVGRSVFERIRNEMREFAGAPLPEVGGNATIEEINAAIEESLGLLRNDPGQQTSPLLPAAHGATIEMDRGLSGAFSMRDTRTGQRGSGVLVGELGPEILDDLGNGRIRITPLSGGGSGGAGGVLPQPPQQLDDRQRRELLLILQELQAGTGTLGDVTNSRRNLSTRASTAAVRSEPFDPAAFVSPRPAGTTAPVNIADFRDQQGTIALSGRRLLSAAHGGDFETDTPGESTLTVQAIAPLFKALGFDKVPLSTRADPAFGGVMQRPLLGSGFGGVSGISQGNTADIFQQLGTRPRLIFEPDLQLFLFVGPDGVVRTLGNAEQAAGLEGFGINPQNAQTATLADLRAMGFTVPTAGGAGQEVDEAGNPIGGGGQAPPTLQPGTSDVFFSGQGTFGELQPLTAPLNEDQSINVLLPDPRLLATIWNKLDLQTQNVAFSFYSKAGIARGQLLRRLRFFRGESAGVPTARLG